MRSKNLKNYPDIDLSGNQNLKEIAYHLNKKHIHHMYIKHSK